MKRLIPIVLFAAALILTACTSSERPEGNLPAATAEPVMTEASATAEPAVTEAPESTEAVREEAHFYSPRFEAAIRNILGRGGEPIYLDELRGMKELELKNSGVVTLNDLALFENLETLKLCGDEIEDISAVASLKKLRDEGNSVMVVEHDAETMMAADWLIDVGPGAGGGLAGFAHESSFLTRIARGSSPETKKQHGLLALMQNCRAAYIYNKQS